MGPGSGRSVPCPGVIVTAESNSASQVAGRGRMPIPSRERCVASRSLVDHDDPSSDHHQPGPRRGGGSSATPGRRADGDAEPCPCPIRPPAPQQRWRRQWRRMGRVMGHTSTPQCLAAHDAPLPSNLLALKRATRVIRNPRGHSRSVFRGAVVSAASVRGAAVIGRWWRLRRRGRRSWRSTRRRPILCRARGSRRS